MNKFLDKNKGWHVLYTRPRYEKKLRDLLARQGIDVFLPLYKTVRQWSDRRKKMEVPLFTSYIFVKADENNYLDILNTPGSVKLVEFEGKPAIISEKEIETINQILQHPSMVAVEDYKIVKGDRIKVSAGPFKNIEGVFLNLKSKNKLVIQIEQLGKNILLELPGYNIQSLSKTPALD